MEGRFDTSQTGNQNTAPHRDTVRHWTLHDVPLVASAMLLVKSNIDVPAYDCDVTFDDLMKWLHKVYADHMSMVFIAEDIGGVVTAVCGVTITNHMFPPHIPIGYEWVMDGSSPRSIATVWKEAKAWARGRKTQLITRSHFPGGNKEMITWEKL